MGVWDISRNKVAILTASIREKYFFQGTNDNFFLYICITKL